MTVPSLDLPVPQPLALEERRRVAFPLVVQNRRRCRGLSRSEIARSAGLSGQTVIDIEEGTEFPTLDVLFALADVLGTDAAELLHETRVVANDMVFHGTWAWRVPIWPSTVTPVFTRAPRPHRHLVAIN